MKKVALISSFCDTQEKINILEKNIKIIKSHDIDVIVISPLYLPKYVVELCDYFFITKDNPVLEWPEKAMFSWTILPSRDKNYRIATTYPDYGYAGLYQVKQLSEIALNLGYDQYHHMIYDLKIDDNVIQGLMSNKTCSVYPSKRGDIFWAVGLHYMIFDTNNLKNFISYITKENYLSTLGLDAFAWLHSHQKDMNYDIESRPVEDEIYYYEDHDFYNSSPIKGLKFFIEKNDETQDTLKLFFYDNLQIRNIKLIIDGVEYYYIISERDVIDLGFNSQNLKEVKIEYNSIVYDLTKIISKIKHNTMNQIW